VNDGHFAYFKKSLNKNPGHNMPMAQHANDVEDSQKGMLEDMFN